MPSTVQLHNCGYASTVYCTGLGRYVSRPNRALYEGAWTRCNVNLTYCLETLLRIPWILETTRMLRTSSYVSGEETTTTN